MLHRFGQRFATSVLFAAACGGAFAHAMPAARAVDFKVIHAFKGSDGSCPRGGLVAGSDGYYYGVTDSGGANGAGTVFRMSRGGGLETLHDFDGSAGGGHPSGLIQASDGNLYGSASGVVFRLELAGAFSVLHTFASGNIANPVIQGADGALYGTTIGWPDTAFRLGLDGSFTTLHEFGTDFFDPHGPIGTLAEAVPGTFHGVTSYGGEHASGSLFSVGADGTFAILHEFGAGGDGAMPFGGTTVGIDGKVLGTTMYGGARSAGTIFSYDAGGAGGSLYLFSGDGEHGYYPGAGVDAPATGALFGTTTRWRSGADLNVYGAIYRYRNGREEVLHVLANDGSEGGIQDGVPLATPRGDLLGVACLDGPHGSGTVWRLRPVPAE